MAGVIGGGVRSAKPQAAVTTRLAPVRGVPILPLTPLRMPPPPCRVRRAFAWSALSVAGLTGPVGGGCVVREMVIDSEPRGALVYLNDQEIGRTPLTKEFTWYGTYDAVVRLEGYETLKT